ncbi:MAG: hypothetical protein AAGH57_14035 [Pseudomonadota bacterium]
MTKLHKPALALATLTAATPAFAHDADFFHTHAEGLMGIAALIVAGGLAIRFAISIARK